MQMKVESMENTLSSQEQRVIDLMRKLPPAAVQEIQDFATFVAAKHCDWCYDDPKSLERAADMMAGDPQLVREIQDVGADFADAEEDGLEDS